MANDKHRIRKDDEVYERPDEFPLLQGLSRPHSEGINVCVRRDSDGTSRPARIYLSEEHLALLVSAYDGLPITHFKRDASGNVCEFWGMSVEVDNTLTPWEVQFGYVEHVAEQL